MPDTIVDVRDMRKVYNAWSFSGKRRVKALNGVSLQAQTGEVFGLLGPNGAGKTTLIKILLGVVKPSGGQATLFGHPLGYTPARSRIGYLPESLRVDRHHTARSALRYYGRMSRMSSSMIQHRSDELLELVGLRDRDKESVRQFSKGMYQRLGLAQALLHDPDLLVLDEPTDGLDPVGRSEVRRVIERLRDAGKTIFLNSHILQEVELVCSRVAIMAKGKIRGIGKIDELSGATDSHRVSIVVQSPNANDSSSNSDGPIADNSVLKTIETCFSSKPEIETLADRSGISLTAEVAGQSEIDTAVDQLRTANLSISKLLVHRPSLEDTFIRLVNEAESESDSESESEQTSEQPPTTDSECVPT